MNRLLNWQDKSQVFNQSKCECTGWHLWKSLLSHSLSTMHGMRIQIDVQLTYRLSTILHNRTNLTNLDRTNLTGWQQTFTNLTYRLTTMWLSYKNLCTSCQHWHSHRTLSSRHMVWQFKPSHFNLTYRLTTNFIELILVINEFQQGCWILHIEQI